MSPWRTQSRIGALENGAEATLTVFSQRDLTLVVWDRSLA